MDDFSDRFGGFFCPHFDQEGTTIIQALQGGKDSGEVSAAFTEGYIAELTFTGHCHGVGIFEVDSGDAVNAEGEFGGYVITLGAKNNVYSLRSRITKNAKTTICRLVLNLRSQFFQNCLSFFNQEKPHRRAKSVFTLLSGIPCFLLP